MSGLRNEKNRKEALLAGEFVGFYWTLPINWAGFRRLPADIEAASAKSRTIRYQKHAVRNWVADNGGRLIKEIIFMELSPDRGTPAVTSELAKVRELCTDGRATLLYVDFAEAFHWRRHPHLNAYLQQNDISFIPLPPEPLVMDGKPFNPIKHFETSRAKHQAKTRSLRELATYELLAAAERHLRDGGTYVSIRDELNERQIRTPTGKLWSEDTVRKTLARRGASLVQA